MANDKFFTDFGQQHSTGPSEGTEKWGVKPQKWGGKNQISAKNRLFLTNFALFLAKV